MVYCENLVQSIFHSVHGVSYCWILCKCSSKVICLSIANVCYLINMPYIVLSCESLCLHLRRKFLETLIFFFIYLLTLRSHTLLLSSFFYAYLWVPGCLRPFDILGMFDFQRTTFSNWQPEMPLCYVKPFPVVAVTYLTRFGD